MERKGGEEVDEEVEEENGGMRAGAKGRRGESTIPTLTSIFIYHRFPGKECPGQGAQFTPALQSEVKHFLLHSPFQRPLANQLQCYGEPGC